MTPRGPHRCWSALRAGREATVGGFGALFDLGKRVVPGVVENVVAAAAPWLQFVPGTEQPSTDGNLYEPAVDGHAVAAHWRERSPLSALLLAGAGTLAILGFLQAIRPVRRVLAGRRHHRAQA
jgi:hypothetical protein